VTGMVLKPAASHKIAVKNKRGDPPKQTSYRGCLGSPKKGDFRKCHRLLRKSKCFLAGLNSTKCVFLGIRKALFVFRIDDGTRYVLAFVYFDGTSNDTSYVTNVC